MAPTAPVGAAHLEALEAVTPLAWEGGGDLTDAEVLEVVAGWSRQSAHAEAMLRAWSAVLSRRASNSPTFRDPDGRPLTDGADELRFRLGVSRRRGQHLIDAGRALTSTLWPVREALESGWIDAGKADLLVELLGEQPVEVALAVCDEVLPVASELDHAGLRRRVLGLLVRVDPDGAGERAERAVRKRRVNAVRPLADGQALFSAVLPATGAVALAAACEAAARAARAGGDGRTLEQLRADVLVALGTNALEAGQVALPTGAVRFSGRTGVVQVIATRAVQDGRPSPVPAVAVVTHDLWTSPDDDALSDDHGVAGLGREHSGTEVVRSRPRRSSMDPGEDPYADWEPCLTYRPGVDAPELVGYGPIPPAMVRELMSDRSVWVRVAEPVLPGESPPPPIPGYRPSAALDAWVRRRDQTCVVPGCGVPATADDLDHLRPWPAGPTAAENLHALCRHDPRLKTHGGYRLERTSEGEIIWRTRLGQELRDRGDGHLVRHRSGAPVPSRIVPRPGAIPVDPERLAQLIGDHDARAVHGDWPAFDDDAAWAALEAREAREDHRDLTDPRGHPTVRLSLTP